MVKVRWGEVYVQKVSPPRVATKHIDLPRPQLFTISLPTPVG